MGDLHSLVEKLRDENNGLPVVSKDKVSIFRAAELIDWLVDQNEAGSRIDALPVAQLLSSNGFITFHHLSERPTALLTTRNSSMKKKKYAEPEQGAFADDAGHFWVLLSKDLTNQRSLVDNVSSKASGKSIKRKMRHMVSLKKKRFVKDGFDLDLTYILPRLIAMGFPSESVEGLYRNPMAEVQKFFKFYHEDKYKVYNLCSERFYDASKFDGRAVRWPFDDHNPCPLTMIWPFCNSLKEFLDADAKNVAAIHCKAGKGRTGLMICTYLLHCKAVNTADEALALFGEKRTDDCNGVTIPSQRRYVRYYEKILKNPDAVREGQMNTFILSSISFDPVPANICMPSFKVFSNGDLAFKSTDHLKVQTFEKGGTESSSSDSFAVQLKHLEVFDLQLQGDIKIAIFENSHMMGKEKLFHAWFNTAFILNSDDDGFYSLDLARNEIDNVHKDKGFKKFVPSFKCRIQFRKIDAGGKVVMNKDARSSKRQSWLEQWQNAISERSANRVRASTQTISGVDGLDRRAASIAPLERLGENNGSVTCGVPVASVDKGILKTKVEIRELEKSMLMNHCSTVYVGYAVDVARRIFVRETIFSPLASWLSSPIRKIRLSVYWKESEAAARKEDYLVVLCAVNEILPEKGSLQISCKFLSMNLKNVVATCLLDFLVPKADRVLEAKFKALVAKELVQKDPKMSAIPTVVNWPPPFNQYERGHRNANGSVLPSQLGSDGYLRVSALFEMIENMVLLAVAKVEKSLDVTGGVTQGKPKAVISMQTNKDSFTILPGEQIDFSVNHQRDEDGIFVSIIAYVGRKRSTGTVAPPTGDQRRVSIVKKTVQVSVAAAKFLIPFNHKGN